jgi:D-alanyl-D-alanine carboxypeptidase
MRGTRGRVVCLVVATAVPAACGGGSPAAPQTTVTTTVTTTVATTTTTPATTTSDPASSLQALLDAKREKYPAPGALGLVRRDATEVFASSGAADTAGTPITAATRFRIASITKPIIAALVLQSVAAGEVSLDDDVAGLLPGIVRADPPITVRMLLDHTSGVFDEGNDGDPVADAAGLTDPDLIAEAAALEEGYYAGEQVIASDRMIVALAETHDRYFAPGEGYHYSNVNYQIAAMVLERVTGSTLADLLRTRIADPLGLTRTSIAPPDVASPEFRGYGTATDDGSLVDLTDDLLFFGNGGNGGIVSTAGELLTIMQTIVSGGLFGDDLVTEMKQPTQQSRRSYGLGLAQYRLTCGIFYGHEGGVNGTASIALVSPDGADGVVIAFDLRDGSDPRLPALADDALCGTGAD